MKYSLKAYKNGLFDHEITGKANVLPRFYEDLQNCTPVNVVQYLKSVSVVFSAGKYTVVYSVPKTHSKGV